MKSILIMGKPWKVHLLKEVLFVKKHGEGILAMCLWPPIREIHFIKEYRLDKATVIHELTHAFYSELCLSSAELKADQVQEVMCDLLAERGNEIRLLAHDLMKKI